MIYTTPLKALSNQKLLEMRTWFGEHRVGLQTGDQSLNVEGDVVIMTTEILRNILYRSSGVDEAGACLLPDLALLSCVLQPSCPGSASLQPVMGPGLDVQDSTIARSIKDLSVQRTTVCKGCPWAKAGACHAALPCRAISTHTRLREGCAGRSVGSARLNNVGLLVLDEVHYLGDRDRGTVWEEVIISCLPHMRLLAMSATIANARQLGGWLSEVRLCLAESHLGPWILPARLESLRAFHGGLPRLPVPASCKYICRRHC